MTPAPVIVRRPRSPLPALRSPLSALLPALALCLLLSSCATPPRVTAPAADHVGELLAHPDARAVARDYPAFFTAALNKIADLSHDTRQPAR